MSRSRSAALGAALLVLLAGVRPARLAAGAAPLKEAYLARFLGTAAPPFSLRDTGGTTVRMADFRGKVVLLNFWYSACFPCRQETPDLIELYRRHQGQGLVVLGINTDTLIMPDDRGQMLGRFLDTFRIPYPVLVADRKMFDDYGRPTIAPLTLLVDRRGTVMHVFWGAFPGAAYEREVRPYLEAGAAATPRAGGASAP